VEKRSARRPRDEIEATLKDLCAQLLLILARLLGGEMAQHLAAEPAVKEAPRHLPFVSSSHEGGRRRAW
jgi:hypothetical protein